MKVPQSWPRFSDLRATPYVLTKSFRAAIPKPELPDHLEALFKQVVGLYPRVSDTEGLMLPALGLSLRITDLGATAIK